jgi:mannose-6-phosphate isomerase-like protein (cupin superfamily)
MLHITSGQAEKFEVSSSCTIYEYGGDADLSGAVAEINGRYPDSGWAMNTEVKEMAFVLSGSGKLVTQKEEVALEKELMILLDKNEPYYFEGSDLRLFMPTAPAWTPDQHQVIQ